MVLRITVSSFNFNGLLGNLDPGEMALIEYVGENDSYIVHADGPAVYWDLENIEGLEIIDDGGVPGDPLGQLGFEPVGPAL